MGGPRVRRGALPEEPHERAQQARAAARGQARDARRRAEPAVYLLTGTPLTNRPRDLFVLLQLVGHPLGRSFLSFAKRYCAAEKNDYGWKTGGASNIEELTVQLHGVMLRRSKDEVLALPPKLRTWLPVDVPAGTGVARHQEGGGAARSAQTAARRSPSVEDDRRCADELLGAADESAAEARRREGRRDPRLRVRRDRSGREGHRLLLLRRAAAAARRKTSAMRPSLLTGRTPAEQAPGAGRSVPAGRRPSACSSRTSSPAASG